MDSIQYLAKKASRIILRESCNKAKGDKFSVHFDTGFYLTDGEVAELKEAICSLLDDDAEFDASYFELGHEGGWAKELPYVRTKIRVEPWRTPTIIDVECELDVEHSYSDVADVLVGTVVTKEEFLKILADRRSGGPYDSLTWTFGRD